MLKSGYQIILFYKFVRIEDPEKFRDEQRGIAASFNLKGRMLIAREGVNATFEGLAADIEAYKAALRENEIFGDIVFKQSEGIGNAFSKLVVKTRKEIVTLGAGEFDVAAETAPEISVEELHQLYQADEDFVVLDLRNDFEVVAGKFEKTVDPKLRHFRDLPQKLSELEHLKKKKVVTVCTGGIRCEKATCLLKREGFENIYQLKDGIHTYMQQYPGEEFKGSLFVFDNRMTSPIVETPNREIISRCAYCEAPCEEFYNDDSTRPSTKIICCQNCIGERSHILRQAVSVV